MGGTFTAYGSLFPWLYRAVYGSLPNANQTFKYGMRHNDFMRFIAHENERKLLSIQEDAIRNMKGEIGWVAFFQAIENATGVFSASKTFLGTNVGYQSDGTGTHHISFDASKSVSTADENRPTNTALTAFVII